MPWNGSGNYILPPAYSPEINGTVINATRWNGLTNDVATGISNAIARDGQNTPIANLAMGGFKHTGASDAVTTGQYVVFGQATSVSLPILFTAAGTGSTDRLLRDKVREFGVSITDKGADPTGVADCSTAFQAALDTVNAAGGGVVLIPAGTFRKADTSPTLIVYANTTIRGVGDASILYHEDKDTNARMDLFIATSVNNIAFENFKITGTALIYTNETNQSQTLTGSGIDGLRIQGMTLEKLRYMAVAFANCKRVQAIGNKLDYIVRDGLRFTNSDNVIVAYNLLRRVSDDSVALHSLDASTVPGGSQVVLGNIFEQCQGIKVLGAKQLTIQGNIFRRSLRSPIAISLPDTGSEGNTPVFSVDILGNNITDTFGSRGTNYAILIQGAQREKLALAQQPGVSTIPFPYNYVQNIDGGAVVNVGLWSVKVQGNIVSRTLPAIAAFSSYGYGQLFDRITVGFLSDPAVVDADFNAHGVTVQAPINGLLIDGNVISGTGLNGYGVNLDVLVVNNYTDYSNTAISNNIFFDTPSIAIACDDSLSNSGSKRLLIRGNTFDLDPFFRNATHNANNTWTSASGCVAVLNRAAPEVMLEGNFFSHCGSTVNSLSNSVYASGNYVLCDPTGIGDNAANIGVRRLDDNAGFEFVVYNGDPTSTSFGQITTMPLYSSAAMPSSGKYVAGKTVWGRSTVVAGGGGSQYIIQGWKRLTTGSAHVLNTDWVEMRTLTGT